MYFAFEGTDLNKYYVMLWLYANQNFAFPIH